MGVDDVTNRDDYKALRENEDVSAKRGGEDGESFVDLLARASEAVRDVVHRYLRWIAGKGGGMMPLFESVILTHARCCSATRQSHNQAPGRECADVLPWRHNTSRYVSGGNRSPEHTAPDVSSFF